MVLKTDPIMRLVCVTNCGLHPNRVAGGQMSWGCYAGCACTISLVPVQPVAYGPVETSAAFVVPLVGPRQLNSVAKTPWPSQYRSKLSLMGRRHGQPKADIVKNLDCSVRSLRSDLWPGCTTRLLCTIRRCPVQSECGDCLRVSQRQALALP